MTYEFDHALYFRVYHSEPEAWLWDWWDGWIDGWEPWEPPTAHVNQPPTSYRDESTDDILGYRGNLWFSWEHDPDSMFDALIRDSGSQGTLPDACEWVRVGYHDCTNPHNGTCSWDEVRSYGPVPDYIESMDPE